MSNRTCYLMRTMSATTVLLVTAGAHADTLHVPSEYPTIQAGIDAAQNGDEVLVADGVYTGPGNRDLDFAGKDVVLRSENGAENCIIDCQGTWDEPHRGFYFHSSETAAAVVEGFTIRNGRATDSSPGASGGAGIYCESSSPTIIGCKIAENSARANERNAWGGGIYGKNSDVRIDNCTITGNSLEGGEYGPYGGGIAFSSGRPTISRCMITANRSDTFAGGVMCAGCNGATFTDCTIESNEAKYDGAMMIDHSTLTMSNCRIANNAAQSLGGIYMNVSDATMTDCTITTNTGGGGIFFTWTDATLTNCTISGNTGGVGVFIDRGIVTLTNCTIRDHRSGGGGGIDCERSSDVTLTNCTISGNRAAFSGGGIHCDGSSLALANCTIAGNETSQDSGGGIHCRRESSFTLANCTITGNKARYSGGGIYCEQESSLTLANCTIAGNEATEHWGGGIYAENSSVAIANCTITANTSNRRGGGVYVDNKTSQTITNCIFRGNTPDEIGVGYTNPTVTYSDVEGGWSGVGNIDADPLFADQDNENYRLMAYSPCINAGDPNFVPEPGETDLDGLPRILCDRVDMGAYEFGIGDFDCDRDADLLDFEQWLACFTGPNGGPYAEGCGAFDPDADGDADWSDFAVFHRLFTGDCANLITQQPQDQIACPAGVASFEVQTDWQDSTYQWYLDQQPIPEAIGPILVIDPVGNENLGFYWVRIENGNCLVDSRRAALTMLDLLMILSHPESVLTCVGAPAQFAVEANGAEPLRFQWQFNEADIPEANEETLTIESARPEDSGSYRCLVADDCDQNAMSQSAELEFHPDPEIVDQPIGGEFCTGDEIIPFVIASNALSFQWYKDDAPIDGETEFFLIINSATPEDSGVYYVDVIGRCVTVRSDDAVVTVIDCEPP